MKEDVTSDAHGVLEVAFDFVENVFGGSAEEDGACLWIFAFGEEGEAPM